MVSNFRGMIEFLDRLGIYDVILPFLLVFTAVFAILEKTKILGMEEIDGKKYTRKNQNSMLAFVISFLVIASTELVRTINEAMANVVILILLSICFMLLVGSLHTGEKEFALKDGWLKAFYVIFFVGIVGIFLHAIHYKDQPFTEYAWDYLTSNWDTNWFGSLILIAIMVGFMLFITYTPDKKEKKTDSKEST
jgi:hypothetical protein